MFGYYAINFFRGRLQIKERLKAMLACVFVAAILFSQVQSIAGISGSLYENNQAPSLNSNISGSVINIDGNLDASITSEERDIIWKGKYASEPDWFSGDIGQSTINLGYNFTDSNNPTATCSLDFVNSSGNRPFPFMSSLNHAFPKLYLNQTRNIAVHFDINLQDFAFGSRGWLRIGVVVALQNEANSSRIFFEQDIQDSPSAQAELPLLCGDVAEKFYANINRDTWVHLDVPFGDFMQNQSTAQFAQSFFSTSNSTFIESVYLVNECFGNGHISYSIANWWITADQTGAQ
jgi:hypothetical protein